MSTFGIHRHAWEPVPNLSLENTWPLRCATSPCCVCGARQEDTSDSDSSTGPMAPRPHGPTAPWPHGPMASWPSGSLRPFGLLAPRPRGLAAAPRRCRLKGCLPEHCPPGHEAPEALLLELLSLGTVPQRGHPPRRARRWLAAGSSPCATLDRRTGGQAMCGPRRRLPAPPPPRPRRHTRMATWRGLDRAQRKPVFPLRPRRLLCPRPVLGAPPSSPI